MSDKKIKVSKKTLEDILETTVKAISYAHDSTLVVMHVGYIEGAVSALLDTRDDD